MIRKYLIEFEDFEWYPTSFRNVQTDFLQIIMKYFDVFKEVYPKIFKIAESLEIYHFMDLCSGGGGAIMQMRKHFNTRNHRRFYATLTDKYPNIKAYENLASKSHHEVNYITDSIDVNKDLSKLTGFWTVFNAFHHLSPLNATRLLKKAVDNKRPIAILEPLDNNFIVILFQSIFLIVGLFLVLPFTKSFSFKVFVFSYLVPILPIAIVWDGWVSAIRVYRLKSLNRMVNLADMDTCFNWDIGTARHPFGKVIYLIGYPIKNIE